MESVGLLAQMGIKVALGVTIAVSAAALARHLHHGANRNRAQTGFLHVTESAALGQNRTVHLIRIGRRSLLIGSTPTAISLLADVTGDTGPFSKEAEAHPVSLPTPRQAFATILSRFMATPSTPARGDGTDRLRRAARALRSASAGSSQP